MYKFLVIIGLFYYINLHIWVSASQIEFCAIPVTGNNDPNLRERHIKAPYAFSNKSETYYCLFPIQALTFFYYNVCEKDETYSMIEPTPMQFLANYNNETFSILLSSQKIAFKADTKYKKCNMAHSFCSIFYEYNQKQKANASDKDPELTYLDICLKGEWIMSKGRYFKFSCVDANNIVSAISFADLENELKITYEDFINKCLGQNNWSVVSCNI